MTSTEIDSKFLLYYLVSPKAKYELRAQSAGSVVSHLNMKNIRAFEIEAPSLDEQKAIASTLSALDDKIDLLHRQNATLEGMGEVLFREWFLEGESENWEEVNLEDLTEIKIGRTPPRKQFEWFSKNEKDVKWVSIKDMGTSGVFIFDTSEKLTAEAVEKFKIPVIPEDTVIMSFKMTIGRIAITTENMLSNEAIAHFKIKDSTELCKEFLYFYLKTYPYQTLGSTSSIVTSINTRMIRKMVVPLPPSNLMTEYNLKVKVFFDKIRENLTQIKTLEALRDTLLPKLMSGAVRVKM